MKTVKITLNQAKEMYNSSSEELKKLALSLYSEDDLSLPSLDKFKSLVASQNKKLVIPYGDGETFRLIAATSLIAAYFNGSWKKSDTNPGYCIGIGSSRDFVDSYEGIDIYCHEEALLGVVYFKSASDTVKAIKILLRAGFFR